MNAAAPNALEDVAGRVSSGQVNWRWPLVMAFIRLPLIAVGVGVATVFFVLSGAKDPLLLSLLATPTALMLGVNVASLLLLRRLVRREGIQLRDLIGFDRARIGRDVGLGLLWLIVLNLPFVATIMLVTVALTRHADGAEFGAAFEEVFVGRAAEAYAELAFPLWWAVVIGVSFALLNPVVEEMHYRGYVQPRLTALSGSVTFGVGVMAVGFAAQHVAYATTWRGALVYFAAFLVWGAGAGLIYRWQRRLPSLIVTHFVINASFGALPIVLALVSPAARP